MLLSLIALIAMSTTAQASGQNSFTIVDHGKAVTSICLPVSAGRASRRAATIFQSAVQKMTGAVVPIHIDGTDPKDHAICLGYPVDQHKPIGMDGFRTVISEKRLSIDSGGGKGAIYGVVDLLESVFRCRCFSPTAWVFPPSESLAAPVGEKMDRPVNSIRIVNGDFNADQDWLDWQRLNDVPERFGTGYYVHTFAKLVPPSQYFSGHPEYFAVINGRRDQSQLCPSNPMNIEIAVKTLKQAMALDPNKEIWSVSQNDNEEYCHCPECERINKAEGSPAGAILRFVNAIAKQFPNKTISTLAYEYSRKAPKITKPDPNVMIMLCTIELTRSAPISKDPSCASFQKDIVDWGKICYNIYLWDYTVDFAHQIMPFPNLSILQDNIKFFVQNHALQHFQQTNTSPGHEFSELKSYLIAKLLWNPNANVDQIESDFLNGYYGAAAPALKTYLTELSDNLHVSGKRLDIFGSPVAHTDGFLSEDKLIRYNKLFDEAEKVVQGNRQLLERVRTARLSIQYAELTIASDSVFGSRGFYQDVDGKPQLNPRRADMIDQFLTISKTNHVRSVNESNLSPQTFCDTIRRLLKLETTDNLAFRKVVTSSPPPATKYGHGDVGLLTNGVHGANDFNIQWLGWEGTDFTLDLDLGQTSKPHVAALDSLNVWRSWILHPQAVECLVSEDGREFSSVGKEEVPDSAQHDSLIHHFQFEWQKKPVRYLRFVVTGTRQLPAWHSASGGNSWVFLDEIVVR